MATETISLRIDKTLADGFRAALKKLQLPLAKVLQGSLFLALVSLDVSQSGRVKFKRMASA